MAFLEKLALSGIGSFISGIGGLFGASSQYNQQKKLLDYQYRQNLDMWNKQNEYNSPKAQMERLQAAGLNPNLVYGNGNATEASAPAPQYQVPDAPNYGEHVGNMLQDLTLQAESVRQQIAESKTRSKLNSVETALKSIEEYVGNKTKDRRVQAYLDEQEFKVANYALQLATGEANVTILGQQQELNAQQLEVAKAYEYYLTEQGDLASATANKISKEAAWIDLDHYSSYVNKMSSATANHALAQLHKVNAMLGSQTWSFNDVVNKFRAYKIQQDSYKSGYQAFSALFDTVFKEFTLPSLIQSSVWQNLNDAHRNQVAIQFNALNMLNKAVSDYRQNNTTGNPLLDTFIASLFTNGVLLDKTEEVDKKAKESIGYK